MNDKNNISIPLFDLEVSAAAKQEVAEVLNSGWLSPGKKIAAFEQGVADLLGCEHAAALSSCTLGLQLVLEAIQSEEKTEVITSPFTFAATVQAILHAGLTPVFADINLRTLSIDPDAVAKLIGEKTLAVMPVDLGGQPSEYDRLTEICNEQECALIADAAHSIGTSYRGYSVAQIADAAIFSFYATKNLTAGEGGMVLSNHEDLVDAIRVLGRLGMTSNAHQRKEKSTATYDVIAPGQKANMSELNAAIGLGQLQRFGADQQSRTAIAERYQNSLEKLSDFLTLPSPHEHERHGWHLYIIRLNLESLSIDRNEFIERMADRGIECGVHYTPIFELSFFRQALELHRDDFPNAKLAGETVVSLPLYPTLSESDQQIVCRAIAEIIDRHKR